jgi:hypothetical protein
MSVITRNLFGNRNSHVDLTCVILNEAQMCNNHSRSIRTPQVTKRQSTVVKEDSNPAGKHFGKKNAR